MTARLVERGARHHTCPTTALPQEAHMTQAAALPPTPLVRAGHARSCASPVAFLPVHRSGSRSLLQSSRAWSPRQEPTEPE